MRAKNKRRLQLNLLLLGFTLVFVLMFLEISLRLSYPLWDNYNTEMWRYSIDVKQVSSHPELSHEHQPYAQEVLYGTLVNISSQGFRDKEYTVEKDAGAFRILMLGDSVTMGWGVPVNETFSDLLEKSLNEKPPIRGYREFEVINTGVGNYNTQMERVTLTQKGLKFDPDLVILVYFINDAELIQKSKEPGFFHRSYAYIFFWDKYLNLQVRLSEENKYNSFYSQLYEKDFEGKINAQENLNQIIKILDERNIPFLIAVFPELHELKEYPFQYVTDFVKGAAAADDVPVFDLLPAFRDFEPQSLWVSLEDAHPNALGHAIASEALNAYLSNNTVLWGHTRD